MVNENKILLNKKVSESVIKADRVDIDRVLKRL